MNNIFKLLITTCLAIPTMHSMEPGVGGTTSPTGQTRARSNSQGVPGSDRDPFVLELQERTGTIRYARSEVAKKCGDLCWVSPENMQVVNGANKDFSPRFQKLSPQEKQAVKNHILSWLMAANATQSLHTFQDRSTAVIATSCTLDLSRVLPLPASVAAAIGAVVQERTSEEATQKREYRARVASQRPHTVLKCGDGSTFLFDPKAFHKQLDALLSMPATGLELVGHKLAPEQQEQIRQSLLSCITIIHRISNDGNYLIINPAWLTDLPTHSPKLRLLKTTDPDNVILTGLDELDGATQASIFRAKSTILKSLASVDDAVTVDNSDLRNRKVIIDISKIVSYPVGPTSAALLHRLLQPGANIVCRVNGKPTQENMQEAIAAITGPMQALSENGAGHLEIDMDKLQLQQRNEQQTPNKFELLSTSDPNNVTFTGFDPNNNVHLQIQDKLAKNDVINALASIDGAVTIDKSDPEDPHVTVDFSKLRLLRTEERPTLLQKLRDPVTLGVGAVCAVATWLALKNSGQTTE